MRTLASSLVLLASSTVALAGGTKLDPAGAADGDSLRGSVLVWHDAMLLTEPSETARSIQLATLDASRRDRVGHVFALKVVSSQGAYVEVELTDAADCNWSHLVVPDDFARVRLFVRKADLAPVLTKPFTKTFADGTSITLAAGTPVVATTTETHVAALRGSEVELDIPAANVGYSYMLGKSRATQMAGQTLQVAPDTRATLGDRTLALTGWEGAPVERKGDTTIVSIDDRCMHAKLAIPSKALADVDETSLDLDGSDTASLGLRDEWYLPKLTPLHAGERQVAVAAKPIYLHAEPMGKNACVERKIGIKSKLEIAKTDAKLRLCAPAKKVARDRLRSARSAHGSTRR